MFTVNVLKCFERGGQDLCDSALTFNTAKTVYYNAFLAMLSTHLQIQWFFRQGRHHICHKNLPFYPLSAEMLTRQPLSRPRSR